MTNSLNNVLSLLPEGAIWAIIMTFVLLLTGWISSIVIATKQKGLVLLAFIPFTNPLAVIAMLFKQTSTGLIPFVAYALAIATWFYGSNYSHRVEFEKLNHYKQQLADQGEPLEASAYVQIASHPNKNVWDHPFLKPLSLAGQKNKEGEQARKNIDQQFNNWKLPKHSVDIHYEEFQKNRLSFVTPFRTIHRSSSHFLQNSGTSNITWPKSIQASAAALAPYFNEERLEELEMLSEAVYRPEDIYPHAWEDGFDMLLPHLSKLKGFTQIVSLWSIYHSIHGNQEDSYKYARLAFKLSETGDSDLLISRLVQIAQLSIALETISAAQHLHLWSDEQWIQIRSTLDSYNSPGLMPNSLRSERAVGYSHIKPLFKQSWSKAMQQMAQIGTGSQQDTETKMTMKILDSMASKFSQAFLAKQWRLCMEAYTIMIQDMEQSANASNTKPWKDIKSNWSDENLHQYGIFAKMLLPALSKSKEKAFLIQVKLELTKTAIDLERYYIKHGQYPKALEDLNPTILATASLDPMTREPLAYKKLGNQGFEIYSVGLNGIDDKGKHIKIGKRNQKNPPDDLLWRISETAMDLPRFQTEE